ncbi:MAG: hypothetical protein E7588_00990 [Ruminococcaceae bacterium]|nr:hypothetical protein [Oscillospiraceae bacterium]
MIKISLLGDSIRMIGYGLKVPELLGDDYEVFQSGDNGRFAKYTYRTLFDMKNDMAGSRIVHWNNGLWDTCNLFGEGPFTPENEYIEYMCKIADILLKRHDKVIFATTTPVSPKHEFNKNPVAERYNSLIVPVLKEKGIIINDLYSTVAKDIDKYICDDKIHLSQEGIDVCAKQVADIIKEVAKTLK